MIGCDTIDYIMIHNCRDCTQNAWAKISIKDITGSRPPGNGYGFYEPSVDLWEAPNITNMAALKNVETIPSGVLIQHMPGMVSLKGAHNIFYLRRYCIIFAFLSTHPAHAQLD